MYSNEHCKAVGKCWKLVSGCNKNDDLNKYVLSLSRRSNKSTAYASLTTN